jgi:mono/diheme cytochrome c family protein
MLFPLLAFAITCSILTSSSAVAAQDDVKARNGQQIAETWCTSCHAVDKAKSATDVAPSLRQIAQSKEMDEAALRRQLIRPHPPMPDLHLSNQTVDLLITYIKSLRGD